MIFILAGQKLLFHYHFVNYYIQWLHLTSAKSSNFREMLSSVYSSVEAKEHSPAPWVSFWLVLWSEWKIWPKKAFCVPHQWFHLGLKDSKQAALAHTTNSGCSQRSDPLVPDPRGDFSDQLLGHSMQGVWRLQESHLKWAGTGRKLLSFTFTKAYFMLTGSLMVHVCHTTALLEQLQLQEFKYIILKTRCYWRIQYSRH